MKKPEILSPAGTKEAFYAAIKNGCDAIYLGGKDFGARAYATNFTWEELAELVRIAHFYKVRVYYTLNTIVKDIEFDKLDETLKALSPLKLDGLIIQDFGVYAYILNNYPEFILHCSTQMNLHHEDDISFVKELGFERVVLSRECSLDDIKTIKRHHAIEIETFVHGALCYCYSGLCLMSSLYGERSGNRGKCAQPCRLLYTVEGENAFYLSPKDQMTLYQLPQLIKAGIDSFKIEGRMKNPEYVGFATKLYRKYTDLAYKAIMDGKEASYSVQKEDIDNLNQLYNRGHFTQGYYEQHNQVSMISYDHSKHQGVKVGTLKIGKQFEFLFDTFIAKDDLLEIHMPQPHTDETPWPEIYLEQDVKKGSYKCVNLYTKERKRISLQVFRQGVTYPIFRIRKQSLNEMLSEHLTELPRIDVSLKVTAHIEKPLGISVSVIGTDGLIVEVQGTNVQMSNNRPMGASDFEKQLLKTKDTPFDVTAIEYDLDDSIFIPIKEINALRRSALDVLQESVLDGFIQEQHYEKRSVKYLKTTHMFDTVKTKNQSDQKYNKRETHFLIQSMEQLHQVFVILEMLSIQFKDTELPLKRIYCELTDLPEESVKEMFTVIRTIKSRWKIECYLCYPHVYFHTFADRFEKRLIILEEQYKDLIDGYLVRTVGQAYHQITLGRPIALDTQLNVFNTSDLHYFGSNEQVTSIAPSLELNRSGLKSMADASRVLVEIPVYQKIALMESANCVYKTRNNRCDYSTTGHVLELKDRKGAKQVVKCHCQMCYNTIYNEKALYLLDVWNDISGPGRVMRLDFTIENGQQTKEILEDWIRLITDRPITFNDQRYTRGHYKRGVK